MADHQSDAMIARLEGELEERNAFIQGTIGNAQDAGRDLSDNETELIKSAQDRVGNIKSQLDTVYNARNATIEARQRSREVTAEMSRMRAQVDSGPVEYRSAGAYLLDQYAASIGNGEAKSRLDVFTRAAAHQKTSDNLGLVPDPIVGEVINFIDASRPVVSFLGPKAMPSATWHRPKVTQHTSAGKQGTNGAAADEKSELVSQKMTITRLDASAVTYGGYVNVSRQNIDFSSPSAMDAIINDLAAQYAIQTEAATCASLLASTTTQEIVGTAGALNTTTIPNFVNALWAAAATIYNNLKGQGRVALAVTPDVLAFLGSQFAPYGPQNQQGTGFSAGTFNQGVMGTVAGIPVILSAGLGSDKAVAFSTSAVEVYEQRVGTLQVAEPSVLGVQVAYAGYFTPMTIDVGGIVKLVNAGA